MFIIPVMIELILYITAMAITPGPNTILSMANAARTGLKKGVKLNIGMLVGITIVTLIVWTASELLYSFIPKADKAMRVLAFIYLVYLALKMLKPKAMDSDEQSASFLQGMLLQLINVKVYLLALTAITAYIMPSSSSKPETVFTALLIPLICFLSGLVWAVFGALIKSFYAKHGRILSVIFALLLLWCAISLFI